LAIKLFELVTSVRESASQLDLLYTTVYDLFSLFRQSIVGSYTDTSFVLSGEIEMDESYFGGRRKGNRGWGAAGKIPVFGILERGGKVRAEVVRNVTGETHTFHPSSGTFVNKTRIDRSFSDEDQKMTYLKFV
jgi:transposase